MKKRQLFIATFLVAAATTVAVVSCKKESRDTLLNNNAQPARTFTPPQVDDMNAYLKGFKKKMQTSAERKDEKTLSIEEAAWHLSSLANYDFANANVQFTDLRYDTLYYNINVSNGQVSLTDLDAVYRRVASDINDFYQSLNLENAHFHFIGASISNGGEIVVTLVTSYTWLDHAWYFIDPFTAFLVCDSLYIEDSCYQANGFGMWELERILNAFEGRPTEPDSTRIYYTRTRSKSFYFDDYIDTYGSPFYHNSRLFATKGYFYSCMSLEEFCYCLDSYLELGTSECRMDEKTILWTLKFISGVMKEQMVGHHYMTVDYGIATCIQQNDY